MRRAVRRTRTADAATEDDRLNQRRDRAAEKLFGPLGFEQTPVLRAAIFAAKITARRDVLRAVETELAEEDSRHRNDPRPTEPSQYVDRAAARLQELLAAFPDTVRPQMTAALAEGALAVVQEGAYLQRRVPPEVYAHLWAHWHELPAPAADSDVLIALVVAAQAAVSATRYTPRVRHRGHLRAGRGQNARG